MDADDAAAAADTPAGGAAHQGSATPLEQALARTLHAILQCAPGAIAATKGLMARARLERPADLVDDAAQIFAAAAKGREGLEGTTAFLQKRPPKWAPQ